MADFSKILAALEKGVQFAEAAVGTIAQLTPYGALATTVVQAIGAVTDTVSNLQDRMAEGKIVLSSTDQATVRGLAERLSALNDQLAQQVDDS